MADTKNNTQHIPFWLFPKPIRLENDLGLVAEWVVEEQTYCRNKLALSALLTSIAFAFAIYLDTHFDPPASLQYAAWGRGTLSVLFLLASILLRWKPPLKWAGTFAIQKLGFGLAVLAAVAYQFQYSEDYTGRDAHLPTMIFVLGLYAGRVGPSFTALFVFAYALIAAYFNIKNPVHFQQDLNHFTMGVVGAFLFQNRIYYESLHFVSEWRERSRLARAENEARVLASHAYSELTKLVYPHVVDQIQSGKKIEQTMRTGSSNAAVLCLDVINSSQIAHERFPEAMEEFQGELYSIMLKNYEAEKMQGNGYRVKDVGDGVYYSIGFPLATPPGASSCDLSVQLAHEAIEAFHRIMGKLDYIYPITCGIGVAYGQIEGFFPSSGLCQYDIRGRAILLANRYQSFRKKLLDLNLISPEASVFAISEKVYANLSSANRARFSELKLGNDLKVRNDDGAAVIYYEQVMAPRSLAHPKKAA